MPERGTVVGFAPMWPEVRCAKCAHVYVPKRAGTLIVGKCPHCSHGSFNTMMTVPQGGVVGEVRDG